jgi:hypothetical protein
MKKSWFALASVLVGTYAVAKVASPKASDTKNFAAQSEWEVEKVTKHTIPIYHMFVHKQAVDEKTPAKKMDGVIYDDTHQASAPDKPILKSFHVVDQDDVKHSANATPEDQAAALALQKAQTTLGVLSLEDHKAICAYEGAAYCSDGERINPDIANNQTALWEMIEKAYALQAADPEAYARVRSKIIQKK